MDLTGRIIKKKYKLNKKIAEGSISNIYFAYDIINSNKPVTIKILKNNVISNKIEDIIRFRNELSAVSKLHHENIINIYEFGEIFEQHYIAMEYVQGVNLLEYLKDKKIPIDECINIIIQISKALKFIHSNNIIHRDLTPGNILIINNHANDNKNNKIKLLDFGLAHIKEFNEIINSVQITDVFGYISPEQCGLIRRRIDERSDLYSLGVIFYQMATGKLPFVENDICSIIHQQIAKIPEVPSKLNPEIPSILDKIILKLLEKEPEKRYQSAHGLLVDLEKYINGQSEFILGLCDRSINLSYRTKLIGREKELEKLVALFNRALKGYGSICFISGEAGTGKTRLVEELKNHIYSNNGLAIYGKCFCGDSKIPYSPFKDALNSFLKNYNNYSEQKKEKIKIEIQKEFKNLGQIILNINPLMKEILEECPPLVSLDPASENKRFHMVASQFFIKLSTIENGLLFVIDDLQWTDDGTLYLLNEIIDSIAEHPLLIIGTYRYDEVSEEHNLIKLIHSIKNKNIFMEEIHLNLFNLEKMNEFISGLLSENPANTQTISEFLLNKSMGNPFFTIEILKQLIDKSVVFYKNNQWNIDSVALKNIEVPGSIVETIFKRIQLLDKKEKDILMRAAVIGKEFELRLLYKLIDIDTAEIVQIVDKAAALQLFETNKHDRNKIVFVHDRIKEAFYDAIGNEEKNRLHLLIANSLEEIYKGELDKVIFDLAHHYIEGGNKEKSIQYAYPAGLNAKRNYANEDAIKYFKKTIELLEESNQNASELWINCKEELGGIYLTIGKYGNAIEIFNEILPFAKDTIKEANLYKQISDAYYRKGDWHNCEIYSEKGLSLLNEKLPHTKFKLGLSITKEIIVHLLHNALPAIFIRSTENQNSDKYKLITGFFEFLSMIYILNNPYKLIRIEWRSLNLAESCIGPSKELAVSICAISGVYLSLGFFKKAKKYCDKGLELFTALNYEGGKAKTLELIGYFYEWQGKFTEAIEYFNKSYDIFLKIGDIKEVGWVLNGLEHCYYYTSDYKNTEILNNRYYETASKTRDYYFISAAYLYYSQYHRESGDLDKAEHYAKKSISLCLEKKIWFNYCTASIELGCNALERREPESAIKYFEEVKVLHEKTNFLKPYLIPVYYNLAQAYIDDYIQKEQKLTSKSRKEYINKIKQASFKALKKSKKWKTHLGGALRAMANYYALIGKNEKAAYYFTQSINHCYSINRKFELIKSYYDYGLFLSQIGNTEMSGRCFETAYQISSDINAELYNLRLSELLGITEEKSSANSIQRLLNKERFSSLDRLRQMISITSNLEEIFDEVISKTIELSGAQRGYIFIMNEKSQKLEIKSSKCIIDLQDKEYSKKIVDSVFKTGNYIIQSNTDEDNENVNINHKKNSSAKLKSILCMPIKFREKIIGVCYLDNPLSGGIFTKESAEFLMKFFSQIGAIIENTLLHKKLMNSKEPDKQSITSSTIDKVKKAISYINSNYMSDISREGLAASLNINPDHLGKAFKTFTGKKVSVYINELRIKEAAKKLKDTENKIIDIAFSVGFESLSTFNRVFLKVMKTTPKKYREIHQ